MNEIHITISGYAGVGKSTIAQAVGRTLTEMLGFKVTIEDEDGSSNNLTHEEVLHRIGSLHNNTEILITTHQQRRPGVAG